MSPALRAYLGAGAAAMALALSTYLTAPGVFARMIGPLPPIAVLLGAAALGSVALARLLRLEWVSPRPLPQPRPFLGFALVAILFALPTILVDTISPWPRDINAPLPEAIGFYGAIAFVAETAFHLVPLALISFLVPGRFRVAAAAAALVEPGFQVLAEIGSDAPGWRLAYMATHLAAFNLVQIVILRRAGFAASLGFRISYYLVWHIAWGTARLELLFGG